MDSFVITNVRVVTEHEIIENGFVSVRGGIIDKIELNSGQRVHRSCDKLDGNGSWLLPGLIDLSSNSLERDMTANSGYSLPSQILFCQLENRLASSGITSVCHRFSDKIADADEKHDFLALERMGIIRHKFVTGDFSQEGYRAIPAASVINEVFRPTGGQEPILLKVDGSLPVLCSGSDPASLLYAVFILNSLQKIKLTDSVNMAAINPARAMGIDRKLGSIEPGKVADLILVAEKSGIISVEKVFVNGIKMFEKNTISLSRARFTKNRFFSPQQHPVQVNQENLQ